MCPCLHPVMSLFGGFLLIFSGFLFYKQDTRLTLIYPDDYGVHFAGDTLFTSDELIKTNPDLVLRFVRASLKGWSYAVENSGEIPDIVQKYTPDADLAIELARMNTTLPLSKYW